MTLDTASNKQVRFIGKPTAGHVTARELIDVLEHALKFLHELDPNARLDWEVVKVVLGRRFALTFSNPKANGAISYGMGELRTLQGKRGPTATPRLSDAVLESAKELGSVLEKKGKQGKKVFDSLKIISAGAPTIKVTPEFMHRVDRLMKTTTYRTEWTEIDGSMDQVTVGQHSRFRIIHALTEQDITCTFSEDTLGLEAVKRALPHRVSVYGRAKLDRTGRIVSIEVERLRQLRDESEFSIMETSPRIDITGGMDASDYVERIRSGD